MGHPLVKLLIIMTKGVIFNEPSFFLTSLVCFGFVLYMGLQITMGPNLLSQKNCTLISF